MVMWKLKNRRSESGRYRWPSQVREPLDFVCNVCCIFLQSFKGVTHPKRIKTHSFLRPSCSSMGTPAVRGPEVPLLSIAS